MNTHSTNFSVRLGLTGSIVLTGFRGSGKSTVGQILAEMLGKVFLDTDVMVTRAAGMTIKEIFDRGGEPLFRKFESEAVKKAADHPGAVISAGGGAILAAENVTRLKACGMVIWLDAPAEVLWKRISDDSASGASRPNLTSSGGLDEVKALLARRRDIYSTTADVVVQADGSPEAVAASIISKITGRQDGQRP